MAGSSPPKDQDIFGNELGLTSAERSVVGTAEVFLKKVLQVDTFSKKGDPTEPKTLIISNSRCYILSQRPTVKLETSFNFLKIQLLECTETKLLFQLPGEKPREFHSTRRDSVEIIGLITAQLKNVFPITPLEMILKLTFDPDSLRTEVTSLRDSLLSAMDRGDASSLQGFLTSYGFLCDFFGVPFNNEVAWNHFFVASILSIHLSRTSKFLEYLKNVYLAHGFRDLNLSDFNHLSTRDLLPVLSTLRHNQFFEGFIIKNDRFANELVEELCYVINVSRAIKKLVLHNASIRPDSLSRLSLALKNNPRSALVHLDLSDNAFDDKSIEALGVALESLPHGLQHLVLANCKISNKGGSMLAQSLKQNNNMQISLVHLNLSGNPFGSDPLASLTFIQEPQTISHLDLSGCGLNLDSVVQVLIRGCQQHLVTLDLSHNSGKGKKGVLSVNVATKLQQFFSSCIAITSINLTDCRLTSEIVFAILEGLSVNPNVMSIDLNVSSNDLGCTSDPGALASVISKTDCLHKLDISDCGLDQCLPVIVESIAGNSTLKHVSIGRNFGGKHQVRTAAMEKLCVLLKSDDCHLKSLCVRDSKLKEATFSLLSAVSDNTSLLKLNISGNQMGNHGARYLAKVLLTNYHLREVDWDHNDTTLCGLQDVVAALKHNYTLRVMPLPLADIGRAGKDSEGIVQEIQLLLCRNHSDERLKVELAARHRGRLLTATQQSSVVSRELVQLEDLLNWAESVHGNSHDDVKEAIRVKNEANKVLKLTDGLYSPQVESEQFQAISAQVKSVLDSFMDQVYSEHIKETSDRMVEQTLKACPTLLTEEAKRTVKSMVLSSSISSDFTYAKKAVTRKAAPEVVSHVSAINLDVAANITELIVEQTLVKLDRANLSLMRLHKAARSSSATPDTKVSRNFTFRVEQNTPPKKKRVRRADPEEHEEEDEVDLPSEPLASEGPALQHLGKTRPKPARMQRGGRSRPTIKPSSVPDESELANTNQEQEENKEKPKTATPTPEPKVALLPPTAAKTPSPQSQFESTADTTSKSVKEEAESPPIKKDSKEPDPHPEDTSKASPKPSPRSRPDKTDEKPSDSDKAVKTRQSISPEDLQSTPEPASPSPAPDDKVTIEENSSPTKQVKEQVLDVSQEGKQEKAPSESSNTPQEQPAEDEPSSPKKESVTPPQKAKEDSSPPTVGSPPPINASPSPAEQPVPSPSPPVEEKPNTPPVTEGRPKSEGPSLSVSEDEHKQVVQPATPEPKIIHPAASPVRSPTPQERPSSRKEMVSPSSGGSPSHAPDDRRGSADGKRTKERKRTGLSKIFGKKSKPESPQPPPEPEKKVETTSQQVGDWEVLESNPSSDSPPAVKEKPSPAVREKPAVKPKQRPQPGEPDSTPAPTEQPPAKKVPIGVAMPNVNMDELTSALGRKKPKVPPPTAEKPASGSPKPDRRSTTESGPPAPKPRPKPRHTKKGPEAPADNGANELASTEPSTDTFDTLV